MHSQVMKLVLICSLAAAISAAPSRSPRFLFFNSLFPYNHHQQQSDFFHRFMPQIQQHPLMQPQYQRNDFQDHVDPLPYADYPVPPFHHYPQPEPEPEPEPEPISPYSNNFQFRDEFRENYGHHPLNNVVPPSQQLQPPKSPPGVRIIYLFTRFPWPLEPVVQRVQNYFSTYTVPTVEPLLDEEVDLGPTIEEVDDYESQLSLAGVPTTTVKPDAAIKPFISSANLTQIMPPAENQTETWKVEESSTETTDDAIVVETTTTGSPTEETVMTTDGVDETTTTAPISSGDAAKKTMTSAMVSKILEDALFSHVLDDTDEIFMHS